MDPIDSMDEAPRHLCWDGRRRCCGRRCTHPWMIPWEKDHNVSESI